MIQNPYKYKGPLDPVNDILVCVPRENQINKVANGIIGGEYWAILGPRQFGKSTFLRQLENSYTDPFYIYFNFEISPKTEKNFYQWLSNKLVEGIPGKEIDSLIEGEIDSPVKFLDFLMGLKLKQEKKKIVLLFDEIELIPSVNEFLHVWSKLFLDRHYKKELEKYSAVITGSVDLIKATEGKTSPFKIASTHYIEPLSDSESEKLFKEPFRKAGIKIDKKAIEKLLDEISGHPQLLQQTCHILLDNAIKKEKGVVEDDVNDAIESLLRQSDNLDTLMQDLKRNAILEELIREIIEEKKPRYLPYKEFSFAGTGSIVEDENGFCAIRNKVYKKFLEDFQITAPGEKSPPDASTSISQDVLNKKRPKVFISYSHKDTRWKELLSKHLKLIETQEILHCWDDSKIKGGQNWYPEIEKNMNCADAAIFLISSDSLNSDFIKREEIPTLLKRRERQGMLFFPILVEYCLWEIIPWLEKIQIRPKNGKPLSDFSRNQRNKECVEIVKELVSLAHQP